MKHVGPTMSLTSDSDLWIPLKQGWRREIVLRSKAASSGNQADCYYRTPDGRKLRSCPQIQDELLRTGSTLELSNFSMARHVLGAGEPYETVRTAYPRSEYRSTAYPRSEQLVKPAQAPTPPPPGLLAFQSMQSGSATKPPLVGTKMPIGLSPPMIGAAQIQRPNGIEGDEAKLSQISYLRRRHCGKQPPDKAKLIIGKIKRKPPSVKPVTKQEVLPAAQPKPDQMSPKVGVATKVVGSVQRTISSGSVENPDAEEIVSDLNNVENESKPLMLPIHGGSVQNNKEKRSNCKTVSTAARLNRASFKKKRTASSRVDYKNKLRTINTKTFLANEISGYRIDHSATRRLPSRNVADDESLAFRRPSVEEYSVNRKLLDSRQPRVVLREISTTVCKAAESGLLKIIDNRPVIVRRPIKPLLSPRPSDKAAAIHPLHSSRRSDLPPHQHPRPPRIRPSATAQQSYQRTITVYPPARPTAVRPRSLSCIRPTPIRPAPPPLPSRPCTNRASMVTLLPRLDVTKIRVLVKPVYVLQPTLQQLVPGARPPQPCRQWPGPRAFWRMAWVDADGGWTLFNRPSPQRCEQFIEAAMNVEHVGEPRPLAVGTRSTGLLCHLFCPVGRSRGGQRMEAYLPELQCLACCCLFHPECVGLPPPRRPPSFICMECDAALRPLYLRSLADAAAANQRAPSVTEPLLTDAISQSVSARPQQSSQENDTVLMDLASLLASTLRTDTGRADEFNLAATAPSSLTSARLPTLAVPRLSSVLPPPCSGFGAGLSSGAAAAVALSTSGGQGARFIPVPPPTLVRAGGARSTTVPPPALPHFSSQPPTASVSGGSTVSARSSAGLQTATAPPSRPPHIQHAPADRPAPVPVLCPRVSTSEPVRTGREARCSRPPPLQPAAAAAGRYRPLLPPLVNCTAGAPRSECGRHVRVKETHPPLPTLLMGDASLRPIHSVAGRSSTSTLPRLQRAPVAATSGTAKSAVVSTAPPSVRAPAAVWTAPAESVLPVSSGPYVYPSAPAVIAAVQSTAAATETVFEAPTPPNIDVSTEHAVSAAKAQPANTRDESAVSIGSKRLYGTGDNQSVRAVFHIHTAATTSRRHQRNGTVSTAQSTITTASVTLGAQRQSCDAQQGAAPNTSPNQSASETIISISEQQHVGVPSKTSTSSSALVQHPVSMTEVPPVSTSALPPVSVSGQHHVTVYRNCRHLSRKGYAERASFGDERIQPSDAARGKVTDVSTSVSNFVENIGDSEDELGSDRESSDHDSDLFSEDCFSTDSSLSQSDSDKLPRWTVLSMDARKSDIVEENVAKPRESKITSTGGPLLRVRTAAEINSQYSAHFKYRLTAPPPESGNSPLLKENVSTAKVSETASRVASSSASEKPDILSQSTRQTLSVQRKTSQVVPKPISNASDKESGISSSKKADGNAITNVSKGLKGTNVSSDSSAIQKHESPVREANINTAHSSYDGAVEARPHEADRLHGDGFLQHYHMSSVNKITIENGQPSACPSSSTIVQRTPKPFRRLSFIPVVTEPYLDNGEAPSVSNAVLTPSKSSPPSIGCSPVKRAFIPDSATHAQRLSNVSQAPPSPTSLPTSPTKRSFIPESPSVVDTPEEPGSSSGVVLDVPCKRTFAVMTNSQAAICPRPDAAVKRPKIAPVPSMRMSPRKSVLASPPAAGGTRARRQSWR